MLHRSCNYILTVLLLVGCGDDDGAPATDGGALDAGVTADSGVPDAGPVDAGPCPSEWAPSGCRVVGTEVPALPARSAWRLLHADVVNSDEVAVVVAPRFTEDWVAEETTFNVTGPVFDSAGHLYFAPLLPKEDVALISIDGQTGERRFAIPSNGALGGGGTPLVLRDPALPERERVVLGLYDRVVALETDGTVIFDVPTGLDPDLRSDFAVFGVSYLPQHDAIVGLTQDGHLYMVAREDGTLLLDPPFSLPGEISPAGGTALPEALVEDVAASSSRSSRRTSARRSWSACCSATRPRSRTSSPSTRRREPSGSLRRRRTTRTEWRTG